MISLPLRVPQELGPERAGDRQPGGGTRARPPKGWEAPQATGRGTAPAPAPPAVNSDHGGGATSPTASRRLHARPGRGGGHRGGGCGVGDGDGVGVLRGVAREAATPGPRREVRASGAAVVGSYVVHARRGRGRLLRSATRFRGPWPRPTALRSFSASPLCGAGPRSPPAERRLAGGRTRGEETEGRCRGTPAAPTDPFLRSGLLALPRFPRIRSRYRGRPRLSLLPHCT